MVGLGRAIRRSGDRDDYMILGPWRSTAGFKSQGVLHIEGRLLERSIYSRPPLRARLTSSQRPLGLQFSSSFVNKRPLRSSFSSLFADQRPLAFVFLHPSRTRGSCACTRHLAPRFNSLRRVSFFAPDTPRPFGPLHPLRMPPCWILPQRLDNMHIEQGSSFGGPSPGPRGAPISPPCSPTSTPIGEQQCLHGPMANQCKTTKVTDNMSWSRQCLVRSVSSHRGQPGPLWPSSSSGHASETAVRDRRIRFVGQSHVLPS